VTRKIVPMRKRRRAPASWARVREVLVAGLETAEAFLRDHERDCDGGCEVCDALAEVRRAIKVGRGKVAP